jgi:glycosyltransferase involved in cell wall biosynthesis
LVVNTPATARVEHGARLKVLALTPYPVESAGTRFRLVQLLPTLAAGGIDVAVRPFVDTATFRALYDRSARGRATLGLLTGLCRRAADVALARKAQVVLVLREAVIGGPPVIERLATQVGRCPLVLDLDDPTWVHYRSPTHGRYGTMLKSPQKSLTLIKRAAIVTCGSRHIAEFVQRQGATATLVPPVADMDTFRPADRSGEARPRMPVVGWIGTHSTYPYLASLLPTLAAVHREHPFILRVVGAPRPEAVPPGLTIDWRDWCLDREPDDFASLDIGIYPLPSDDAWAAGKSGLKSVLYLASGVPFVASRVGAAAEIGVPGTTHLLATDDQDWRVHLLRLLEDPALRASMGRAGRAHAEASYSVDAAAVPMADALREAAG